MGLFDGLNTDWLSSLMQAVPGQTGTRQSDNERGWLRPDSPLYNMFNGPFNAPLGPGGPSQFDESGFAGAFPNAPQNPQPAPAGNVPLPQPRPAGLGQPQMQPAASEASAAAPGPPLNIQPQAQSQPMQPQAQPQELSMGDRFMAGVNNLNSGGNPITMLANVAQGFSTGQRMDPEGRGQANRAQMTQAIYGAMTQRGIPPQQAFGIAQAAAADPKIAEKLLPQALGLNPPATVEGVIAESMYNPGNRSGGAQGAAGGQPAQSPMAEYENYLQRTTAAKKGGEVIGERQAKAAMDLPSAVAQAKEAVRLVGVLRNHKGRDNPVFWHGKASAYLPDSAIPGNTDARDAVSILNQIKGGAFLQAFESLKGGGAITEIEGRKATDAITRMERAQSRAEFDRALSDYEGVLQLGIDKANQMAGLPAPNNFRGNAAPSGNYDWSPSGGLKQRK